MELKSYQKRALDDLRSYLGFLADTNSLEKAWEAYWDAKGQKVGNSIEYKGVRKYNEKIKAVPNICAKIPTAGGKTFLACASLKVICDEVYKNGAGFYHNKIDEKKFVIFLVPSEAILSQMLKNLKSPNHPYRQRLMADFGGSISVFDAKSLLDGLNENTLSELNVAVLSFASLRIKDKNLRKFYQENGSLYSLKHRINDNDDISVVNVLRSFKPVVVIDESHNAKSELSLEMIESLNASFIYELTATPKQSSNIIHITKASELKKENMVKLPVFLYNLPKVSDVIANAISIRNKLENIAKDESANVRPIVLFQASSANSDESFEKIKEKLVGYGIPATQIAIKTANKNEIAGIDLMSKTCGIRYIITINALKEGWDCPNAYILASLANRNSKTDVEQLIGRVLRQPYAKRFENEALNVSYVLTSSNDFGLTAQNVVAGLNGAGFSKEDCRQEDFVLKDDEQKEQVMIKDNSTLLDEVAKNSDENSEVFDDDNSSKDISENIINTAKEAEKKYNDEIVSKDELMDGFGIKFSVAELPIFMIRQASLFDEAGFVAFEPEMLDKEFKLSDKDRQINFQNADIELIKIDIDSDEIPKYQRASANQKEYFKEYLMASDEESKMRKCASKIHAMLNNDNSLNSDDLKRYVELVISDLSPEQKAELPDKYEIYANLIKEKIKALKTEFRQKKFYEMLDTHKIEVKAGFELQKSLKPKESDATRPKSLYEEEINNLNELERRILDAIIACDNVKWWHRNADRDARYFHINGFINHYPDFLVGTQSGKIIAVEAKGDDRTNDDSKAKLKLGKKWADKAGAEFEYYMVFDKNKIDDAYTISEFINILSAL